VTTTLTLDLSVGLLRPSILDPVEEPRTVHAPLSERLRREVEPAPGDDRGAVQRTSEQGGGLTLDDLVVGVWEGLSAHRTVACPACGEAMTPRYGAGPAPVGGRCSGCGTTIA
jgi:hypothetical protein